MWSSGFPTVATSGAAFLTDPRWGAWRGMLAVAELKGQGVLLMRMNPTPGAEPGRRDHGAAAGRGARPDPHPGAGPDGALWLTTSNGSNDRIVRIAPTATVPCAAAGQLVLPSGRHPGAHRHRGDRLRPQHRRRGVAAAQHRRRRDVGRLGVGRASRPRTPPRPRRRRRAGRPRHPQRLGRRSCTRGTRAAPGGGRPTSAGASSRSTPPPWATARSTSSPCAPSGDGLPQALGRRALERLGVHRRRASPPGCRRRPTRPAG